MPNVVIENLLKMHISRAEMVKSGFSAQKYDDVCRGRSSYKVEDLIKISEKFQLSLDFLIKGSNANYISLSNDEETFLKIFKKLSMEDKTRIFERAETLVELAAEREAKEQAAEQSKKAVEIPLIVADEQSELNEQDQEDDEEYYIDLCALPASAGSGVQLDEGFTEPLRIKRTSIAERANYAIRVSGNSMEPKYFDGDIVLIETCPVVEIGEIGIFIVDDQGYIKKRGSDRLISLNPECEDVFVEDWNTAYCRGRVLGKAEVMD